MYLICLVNFVDLKVWNIDDNERKAFVCSKRHINASAVLLIGFYGTQAKLSNDQGH